MLRIDAQKLGSSMMGGNLLQISAAARLIPNEKDLPGICDLCQGHEGHGFEIAMTTALGFALSRLGSIPSGPPTRDEPVPRDQPRFGPFMRLGETETPCRNAGGADFQLQMRDAVRELPKRPDSRLSLLRGASRVDNSLNTLFEGVAAWPSLTRFIHAECVRLRQVEWDGRFIHDGGQFRRDGLLTFNRGSTTFQESIYRRASAH